MPLATRTYAARGLLWGLFTLLYLLFAGGASGSEVAAGVAREGPRSGSHSFCTAISSGVSP